MNSEVFNGYGVQIELASPEDFLKIKETLTRMGVASKDGKRLFQTCHILHKRGLYAIVHFKEMFALDNRETSLSEGDLERRNTIAFLLSKWGLVKIVNEEDIQKKLPVSHVKIVSFSEKNQWELISKYTIGKNNH